MGEERFAWWSRAYRLTRCYSAGCDKLAPLKQDPRWKGAYCAECQMEMARRRITNSCPMFVDVEVAG
jgi:hypothetical protein